MPDRFVETHIRVLPMFRALRDEQLDLVVRAFQVLRFQPGEWVVREGNTTQGMFIIVEGTCALVQKQPEGSEEPIQLLGPDTVFDREALFRVGVENASLRALDPLVVLFLSHQRMLTVLSYYPELSTQLSNVPADQTTHQPSQPQQQPISRNIGNNVQRENEEIILVRRRHPWSFVRRGWASVMILILFAAFSLVTVPFSPLLSASIIGLGVVISGLLMTYFFFEWRNDSFVVTDHRVIRIERVIPTFSVNINELPLDSIQQVNISLPPGDLFARIFNYGDVELKNASDAGDLVLDMISKPEQVQSAIFSNREQRLEIVEENKRHAIRAEIERTLGIGTQAQGSAPIPINQESNTKAVVSEDSQTGREIWASISPAKMQFTNKDGNTVVRKHVTIWLAAIFAPSFVIFSAFVILAMSFISANPTISLVGFPLSIVTLILGGLWFWWSDWDWRNDMYIIGDDRITLIHKRPLWLQNEVDQVLLNRIDNVVSETHGLWDTIFQRGDVKLSMVGEGLDNAKVFHKVHRPHEIQAEISRRQARSKQIANNADSVRQREAITEYLSVYHETVNKTQDASPTGGNYPSPQPLSPQVAPYSVQDSQRPPRVPNRTEPEPPVQDDSNSPPAKPTPPKPPSLPKNT